MDKTALNAGHRIAFCYLLGSGGTDKSLFPYILHDIRPFATHWTTTDFVAPYCPKCKLLNGYYGRLIVAAKRWSSKSLKGSTTPCFRSCWRCRRRFYLLSFDLTVLHSYNRSSRLTEITTYFQSKETYKCKTFRLTILLDSSRQITFAYHLGIETFLLLLPSTPRVDRRCQKSLTASSNSKLTSQICDPQLDLDQAGTLPWSSAAFSVDRYHLLLIATR